MVDAPPPSKVRLKFAIELIALSISALENLGISKPLCSKKRESSIETNASTRDCDTCSYSTFSMSFAPRS